MGGRPIPFALGRLFRISVALSPVADVLTGFAASKVHAGDPFPFDLRLLAACGASAAVFCFGVSLNDILDRKKDERLTPERPLPAGEISLPLAWSASILAALLALLFGALAGGGTALAVAVVIILSAAYNLGTRRYDWLGVINLGCIRAADLWVGFSLGLPTPQDFTYFSFTGTGLPFGYILALYGGYGLSLSVVALGERGQRRFPLVIPALFAVLLGAVPVIEIAFARGLLLPAFILWLVLSLPVFRFFETKKDRPEILVGHLVSGFFLLAALIVLGMGDPLLCAVLWILYFVSRMLSKWFPPA